MLFGSVWSNFWGAHEDFLLVFVVEAIDALSARVFLQPRTDYGGHYWLVVADGVPSGVVLLPEGEVTVSTVPLDSTRTSHVISICPLGDWEFDPVGVDFEQGQFISDKGLSYRVSWDAVMDFKSLGDSSQLSAWALVGISRFGTSEPSDFVTQAELDIDLSDAAGTRTLELSVNGLVVASGSRVGDGSITLSEVDDSGVSGSVIVAYTTPLALGVAMVRARWAKSYAITVDAAAATTYNDTGRGDRYVVTVGPYVAGSHTIAITPTSDSGIAGTAHSGSFAVPGRPNPVTNLALRASPGNFAATNIQFTASTTAGATYNLYDSALGEPVDLDVIVDTHIAGTGTLTWTLPAIGSGTGIRRIVVAALNGGVEDGQRTTLEIEYAAGVIVLPRPNAPSFNFRPLAPVTAGRTIHVEWSYNRADEEGVGATVQLYLVPLGGAVPGSPSATVSLTSEDIQRGTISATAGADGYYKALVKIATAAGTQSNNTDQTEAIVWASNTVLAAPGNVEVEVAP